MNRRVIETSLAPEIRVEQIGGNLVVKGWENPQVVVLADDDELRLQQGEDEISLSSEGNCELRVPQGAALQVGVVHGNAQIKLLEEALLISTVHGALVLRNVADVQAEAVHGELSVKGLGGDLRVQNVYGNADIRRVEGECKLAQVQGNLDLQGVEGNVQAVVQGNARLGFDEMIGQEFRVRAEGNIQCTIPEDADLNLELESQGEKIQVQLPDGGRSIRQPRWTGTLGAGSGVLALSAGGGLQLLARNPWPASAERGVPPETGFGANFGTDFGDQIARQVEAQISQQMAEMTRRMNEQMAQVTDMLSRSNLSAEESERIMAQAMRTSEQETARAEEKMRRAQEKLERKLEASRRKAELKAQAAERRQRGRGWQFEWSSPPAPPARPAPPAPPASPQVTEEERLMILRMLAQKKISLEEADNLLTALEGKE